MRLLAPEEAVVVDGHINAQSSPAQGNMVFLGACKMVERVRELAIVDHAQIHIDAAAEYNTGFCLTFAGDRAHRRLAGEYVHNLAPYSFTGRIVNADDHVDIAYGFAAAAQAASRLQAHNFRQFPENSLNAGRLFLGHGIEKAVGVLRKEGDALQDFILRLFAEAR